MTPAPAAPLPPSEEDPDLDMVEIMSRRFAEVDARVESGDNLMQAAVDSANSAVQNLKASHERPDSALFKIKGRNAKRA